MPDPKLKDAMEEIKAVLAKHDIAGTVHLVSQTHGEHLFHLTPTWSCVKVDGQEVRVRCKLEDFPDKAAQKKCLETSIGMLASLLDMGNVTNSNMTQILALCGEQFEIMHRTWRDG